MPEWVVRGLPGMPSRSRLCGKESVGALRFAPRRLSPGETADYIVVMGILEGQETEDRKEEEYLDKLGSRIKAAGSLERTKKSWRIGRFFLLPHRTDRGTGCTAGSACSLTCDASSAALFCRIMIMAGADEAGEICGRTAWQG